MIPPSALNFVPKIYARKDGWMQVRVLWHCLSAPGSVTDIAAPSDHEILAKGIKPNAEYWGAIPKRFFRRC